MNSDYSFTLNGVRFEGAPLSPERSLDGFALLTPLIGPVLDAFDGKSGADKADQLVGALLAGLKSFAELPKFRPLFLGAYKASVGERMMPLSDVADQVFRGKPALQVAWLVAAVHAEYRDFLAETGRATLSDLASRFGFQITSRDTGPSGESS